MAQNNLRNTPSKLSIFVLILLALLCLSEHEAAGLTLVSQLPSSMKPTTAVPSNDMASRQLAAWIVAFNCGDRKTLLSYHANHFPYDVANLEIQSIGRELMLYNATGGFDIAKTVSKTEYSIHAILRERKRPSYVRVKMEVNTEEEGCPVSKFNIRPTHTPLEYAPDDRRGELEKALAPLNASRRECIVKGISDTIDQKYINPEIGQRMIAELDNWLHNGNYDNYTDSEEFAERLEGDLRDVSHDKHLDVMFLEPHPRHDNENDGGVGGEDKTLPEVFDRLKILNFGFSDQSVEKIHQKQIAFVKIDGFVPSTPDTVSDSARVQQAISDILSQIANTDALIIDLRDNGGGHPGTVAFILSHLLDHNPVLLNDVVDRDGTLQESFSTVPRSELPANATLFGGTKPLIVLTSKKTISGGEEMAYDLQALSRAKYIIGEDFTTAGAANIVRGPVFLCEGQFGPRWWLAAIPSLHPVNGVTGANWEGGGVRSDIVVEAGENAKDVARKLAKKMLRLDGGGMENLENNHTEL